MKKLIALAVCTTTLQSVHAVTLPFTDHVAYSDGNLYTVATGVWDAGGNTGGELTVGSGAALTAPSGLASSSDKGIAISSSGTARRNMVTFASVSSGEIYASFLVNVSGVSGSNRLLAYLENTASSTTTPELGVFL